MTFEYRDHDGDKLVTQPDIDDDRQPVVFIDTPGNGVYVPLDRVEEVVAGIWDAARQAAGQPAAAEDEMAASLRRDGFGDDEITEILRQPTADPTTADDPVPLRWGLNDVLYGDDNTITVCLSGPDREPYRLELDPEQAAILRDDLAGPTPAVEQPAKAHPPRNRWQVETYDPLAEDWGPGTPRDDEDEARDRLHRISETRPTWSDGTSVERRLVRETTTWTVEETQ